MKFIKRIKSFQLHLLISVFFSFAFTTAGNQIPIDPDTGLAGYKGVTEVVGVSATELYDRGLTWVNKYYSNPSGVLKTTDRDGGQLIGKARFKISRTDDKGIVNPNAAIVAYQLKIQFKEGKFRYIIDRIRWEKPSYYDVSRWADSTQANYNKAVFGSYIEQTAGYFEELTSDLVNYVRIGAPIKDDDW